MPTIKDITQKDENLDSMLRPTSWGEYMGQENAKRHLRIILDAAKKRGEPPDHLLFYGQAGLGKTTLAYLVAKETGSNLKVTSGPAMEKMADLASILSNLDRGDILFIDEAHRINRMIEEVLYPAMESRKLHIIIGKGPTTKTFSVDLPPFTLIAATTRADLLSAPFRSRFGGVFQLDYYDQEDIEAILKRSAKILNLNIEPEAIMILSRASRATPRVANRLLKRCRDYCEVNNIKKVTAEAAGKTMEILDVDEVGLEPQDRRLIAAIIEKFNGGPVGINALAAVLNEERRVLEDIYEPYLMKIGFINRTPMGRVATPAAYRHLKVKGEARLL